MAAAGHIVHFSLIVSALRHSSGEEINSPHQIKTAVQCLSKPPLNNYTTFYFYFKEREHV